MSPLHDLLPRVLNNKNQELEDFFFNPWSVLKVFDVDVKETEKLVTIEAELPGYKKGDIHVELEDFSVCIRATRQAEDEEKGEKYVRRERQYGKMERTIPLPAEVNVITPDAKYEDGVLKITLEKRIPSLPRRQSITIH